MRHAPFIACGAAVLLALTTSPSLAAPCAPQGSEPVDAIRQMYAHVTIGDRAGALASFDPQA